MFAYSKIGGFVGISGDSYEGGTNVTSVLHQLGDKITDADSPLLTLHINA